MLSNIRRFFEEDRMSHLPTTERTSYAVREAPAAVDLGKLERVSAQRAAEPPPIEMTTAVRQLLMGLGEDPDREGLIETPRRVALMLRELTSGYEVDLDGIINGAVFRESYDEPVLVRDIGFHSMCEHHLLPFSGVAHVAYVPNGLVVGLSKISRVVETFARRLQVQERLTCQIADFLQAQLDPLGVAVIMEANHLCSVMRGVEQPNSMMRTQALRGVFRRDRQLLEHIMRRNVE
jgi:GTP cyclohydrolase I